MMAAANGHTEVVSLLLVMGANLHLKDKSLGMTALEMAKKFNHEEIVALLSKVIGDYKPQSKPEFDPTPLTEKAEKQKSMTLVFRSFYLGMPISDAQKLLNHYLNLPQAQSEPVAADQLPDGLGTSKLERRANLFSLIDGAGKLSQNDPTDSYLVCNIENTLVLKSNQTERPFALADAGGNVTCFEINNTIRNRMFDTGAMPTEEFIRTFCDAYGIAQLTSERRDLTLKAYGDPTYVGFQDTYSYRSPKGYEFIFYQDPVIIDQSKKLLVSTMPGQTIIIQKIKTAQERISKFD